MPNVKEFEVLGRVINVRDSEARTRIDSLVESLNPEVYGSEMVVLGDSFTQGYLSGGGYANPNMPTIIANELGLNLHNYGVNASGYTIDGNTFQSQAQRAIADTSYNHDRVKYVLVIGGINDSNAAGFPNCTQASKLLQNTLSTAFKNATIFIIPNWGAVALDIPHMEVFRSICEVANDNSRVTFLHDNLKTLIPYYNLMGADNVHPTQEGYYKMAKSIAAMILGGHLPRSEKITATAGNGWDISGLNVIRGEDDFIIYGFVQATADITVDKMTIATLPPESGCTAAGSFIECFSSNLNNYPIRIEVGLALQGLAQDGFIGLAYDRGNTIHAGDTIAINFRLPILYI